MQSTFQTGSGTTIHVGTEPARDLPDDNSCSGGWPAGLVHLSVDVEPLGDEPIKRIMRIAVVPSYARAIASAILSAATETRL